MEHLIIWKSFQSDYIVWKVSHNCIIVEMEEGYQDLFTPLCKFCQAPAERICCHHSCTQYPFFCSQQSLCLNDWNLPSKFHDHDNNQKLCTIPISEFKVKLGTNSDKPDMESNRKFKKLAKTLKRKIDDLVIQHQRLVLQNPIECLNQQVDRILTIFKTQKYTPNLVGQQINFLMSKESLFSPNQVNLKKVRDNELKLQRLLESVDLQIQNFHINKFQQPESPQSPRQNLSHHKKVVLKKQHASTKQKVHQFQSHHKTFGQKEFFKQEHSDNKSENPFQAEDISSIIGMEEASENRSSKRKLQHKKQKVEDILKQAKKKAQEEDYNQANKKLKQALQKDNSNYQIYYLLGQYSYMIPQTDPHVIIDYYNKSLELNPHNHLAYNGLGLLKQDNQMMKQAIEHFTSALKYEKNPLYYYNRGASYFRIQEYKKSIQDFTSALQFENDQQSNAEYYYSRGVGYSNLYMNQEALKDFDSAININPKINRYYKQRRYVLDALQKKTKETKSKQEASKTTSKKKANKSFDKESSTS